MKIKSTVIFVLAHNNPRHDSQDNPNKNHNILYKNLSTSTLTL